MRLVIACLVAALPARSFRVACGRARWATRAGAADPTAYEASEPSAADPITTHYGEGHRFTAPIITVNQ